MSIVSRLQQAAPDQRAAIISERYEKNRIFFREHHPQIADFIASVECPYHFDITDQFLNIIHTPTGNLAHPEAGLDLFAELMGKGNHQAWIDLLNCERAEPTNSPDHCDFLHRFQDKMNEFFPELGEQLEQKKARVRTSGAGGNFSPPVVFAGIFHGLHIEYFLDNTVVTRILMVELEPERFEVSCYFLDYAEISKRFGQLPLSIGPQVDKNLLNWFHSSDKVTSRLWMRVLPGYVSKNIDPVVEQILLQQHVLDGTTTSLDNEEQGMLAGWQAIQNAYPFLTEIPNLSAKSRIVIVASGPSLANDFDWLKNNRDKVIIFAVHSAIRPLRNHGIRPDFQFSIDMHLDETVAKALQLHLDVPLIGYYKSSPAMLDSSNELLLVAEQDVANPVAFSLMLTNTHPSTTTLAFSLACLCKPNEIYLVGVDLGFIDPDAQAITGGIHDQRKKETDNIYESDANFPERNSVLTNPFFTKVRLSIERMITQTRSGHHVCNLSDGARVTGTSVAKSSDVLLSEYHERKDDVRVIHAAFQKSEKGRNWQEYEKNGAELLELFKTSIESSITLVQWDWPMFSNTLDTVLRNAMTVCMQKSGCLRMTLFERLINDLLTAWYRYLLLCSDQETAGRVYTKGREEFLEILNQLKWPIDGDY